MKELSIEGKAKAYDEAIKRAKSAIKECGNNQGRIAMIESIFPELKESEDERIRKALLELVHDTTGDELWVDYNVHKEDALAWLEKQDEQKPFDYENANIQQKDFAPQEDAPRYSIGDVLCDKSCTTLDKDAQPNYEIVDIRNGLYICDKGYIPISQQDEYELVAKKIEQKPWSEEDEENLTNCIEAINLNYKWDNMVDWLKSLKDRYTWKPSDEQMKALHDLNLTGNISYAGQGQTLIELYNDLKKLKGE